MKRNIIIIANSGTDPNNMSGGDKNILANLESTLNNLLKYKKSSPIGLYFASIWYDEMMYPLIFSLQAMKK